MTVAELQARMSSREFSEWQAYDSLEPIGEVRGDARAALVAATIANLVAGIFGKEPRPISDFLLQFDAEPEEKKPPSPEEVYAKLKTVALLMGAKHAHSIQADRQT